VHLGVVVEGGEREGGGGSVNMADDLADMVDDVYPWLHDEHVYFPFQEMPKERLGENFEDLSSLMNAIHPAGSLQHVISGKPQR